MSGAVESCARGRRGQVKFAPGFGGRCPVFGATLSSGVAKRLQGMGGLGSRSSAVQLPVLEWCAIGDRDLDEAGPAQEVNYRFRIRPRATMRVPFGPGRRLSLLWLFTTAHPN